MAPTLAAVVNDTTKTVALTVTGALGAISVKCVTPQTSYTVRGTFANGRATIDYDAPLNTDLVYIATDAGPPTTTSPQATARVNATTFVLSVMSSPVKIVMISTLADDQQAYVGASTAHKILGTNVPLVTVEPPAYRSGTFRFHAPTVAVWLQLRDVLMTGQVCLLRSPCPTEILDTSFIVTAARTILNWSARPPRVRIAEWDYQAVAPDSTPPQDFAWTWADVTVLPNGAATWADVPPKWATWADLALYVPPAP